MYKVVVTKLAEQDLDRIVLYILERLKNPKEASDFLNEVEKCYNTLPDSPRIYEECEDRWLKETGYRKVRIKNYIAIYKIEEKLQLVEILRVFHETQDYPRLI